MQNDLFLSAYDSPEYAAILRAARKAGLSRPDAYYIGGAWRLTAGPIRTMYAVRQVGGSYEFTR